MQLTIENYQNRADYKLNILNGNIIKKKME